MVLRQGFTLMEVVLVMVLIAILSVGVAIGFSSYIDKAHETGIKKDFNGIINNSVRVNVIEKGKIPSTQMMKDLLLSDGFKEGDDTDLADNIFDVKLGVKHYVIKVTPERVTAIAMHSQRRTSIQYEINELCNDIKATYGTATTDVTLTFNPD